MSDYPYSEGSLLHLDGTRTYWVSCACGKTSEVTLAPASSHWDPEHPEVLVEVPAETSESARARAMAAACTCGAPWPARPNPEGTP